ncbi:MAG: T9SS type A sorting domain-containing protein [Bacteroidota bacterium]
MKQIAKIFLGGILALTLSVVKAQLPNPSFETWKTQSFGLFSVSNPTGWNTSNLFSRFSGNKGDLPVVKTTDAQAGSSAIILRTIIDTAGKKEIALMTTGTLNLLTGESTDKFKLEGKPTKLKLYYKFLNTVKEEFSIIVTTTKNETTLGSGFYFDSNTVTNYTLLEIPIDYNDAGIPDSASINILVGNGQTTQAGAALYIDNISLVYESTGIDKIENKKTTFKIYPNPAKEYTNLLLNLKQNNKVSIQVTDITGALVFKQLDNTLLTQGTHEFKLETASLVTGIYFIQIITDEGVQTQKLIINN